MAKNGEAMSVEEFLFDEMDEGVKVPVGASCRRVKRSGKNLFRELKVKMVMRIYGVSRAKALEIVAARAKKAGESGESGVRAARPPRDDGGFMGAEEFFRG